MGSWICKYWVKMVGSEEVVRRRIIWANPELLEIGAGMTVLLIKLQENPVRMSLFRA